MSTARRRSVSASRGTSRTPQMEPPKKSKAVLIAVIVSVIVIIIIVIVVVVLLLRRRSSSTTTPSTVVSRCTTDEDCFGNKVCKTTTGVCVTCLSDAECSGTTAICNTANNTCVTGCLTDANCSGTTGICDIPNNTCITGCLSDANCVGGTPVCDVPNTTCVGCLTDGNCEGVTPLCDVPNTTCVGCLTDGNCSGLTPFCDAGTCVACSSDLDCAPFVCIDGTCCNTTSPTLSSIVHQSWIPANLHSFITANLTFSQNPMDVTAKLLFSTPASLAIGELPIPALLNGANPGLNTVNMTDGGLLFPGTDYKAQAQYDGTCGGVPWTSSSNVVNFTTPARCASAFAAVGLFSNVFNRTVGLFLNPPILTNPIKIGLCVKLGVSVHPNDYDYIFRNLAHAATFLLAYGFTVAIPTGPTLTFGSTYTLWWFEDTESTPVCISNPIMQVGTWATD